jgi:CRP/FNR family transcriptional regulator
MKCLCEKLAGEDVQLTEKCFGGLWLFENLKPRELADLVQLGLRGKYLRGEPIFRQGEPADKMFLIKGGLVKLSKVTEDGSEITLDIRKAGDVLGENLFGEDGDYPMTAWCMEETLICGLTRAQFEKLVTEHPNVGLQVIKNLSRRIAWLTDRMGSMSTTNLEKRLYRVLINVATEHGEKSENGFTIHFPLTHEDLSFLVGAHRVSITRAMKDLKSSGRIIQTGKTLTIPQLEPM